MEKGKKKRGQFLILLTPRPSSPGDTRDGSDNHECPSTDARRSKITAARSRSVHNQRLVALGAQVAEGLVAPVEATRVSALRPFHPGDQIGLRRLDHPMKMIRKKDKGVSS